VSLRSESAMRPWHIPMTGRDPEEPHRAATPLELLFDLCFVVAVAQAAGALHHDLVDGKVAHGLINYLFVFFAIWWPWMNFTWFASAYDTDDVLYRLLTFVQIAGVLVVTAGVPSAFESLDFRIMVVGYVIMRIALVAQWLRAAREDPTGRPVALRFALGVGLVQLGWVLRLAFGGPLGIPGIVALALLDLAIPIWAERSGRPTPWHPEHIAERYGLFTIIVLGECVLASSSAVQLAMAAGEVSVSLLAVALGGLLLVFALWWSYFKHPAEIDRSLSLRQAVAWGYSHYVVFAAIAALGAGLQVAIDATHEEVALSPTAVALTVAIPVIVYTVAMGLLHRLTASWRFMTPFAVVAGVVVAIAAGAAWFGVPAAILLMALVLVGFVAWMVASMTRPAVAEG
jgi:low temperature requirement protein LtrA